MILSTLARWACVIFLSVGLAACEAPDPLIQIIERNIQARGGADAVASVQTIQTRVQITEQGFQVMGEYVATRDGKMRIDVYFDGQRVFTEAFDGESGWQMDGDGTVADMSQLGEKAVRHSIITNLYGLNEMAGLGLAVEYVGTELIDSRAYEKVNLTFEDGLVIHYYLDSETGQIVRQRDEVALHPDVDDTIQRFETINSDFGTVDGVVYAFHAEKRDMDTGEMTQITQVEKIILNGEIDQSIFKKPASE